LLDCLGVIARPGAAMSNRVSPDQGLAVEALDRGEDPAGKERVPDVADGALDAAFGEKRALQTVARVARKFSMSRILFIRYGDRALISSRCATTGVGIASRIWVPRDVCVRCRSSGLMSTSPIWQSRLAPAALYSAPIYCANSAG